MSAHTSMHVVTLTGEQLTVLRLLVRIEIAHAVDSQDAITSLDELYKLAQKERDLRTLAAVLVLA